MKPVTPAAPRARRPHRACALAAGFTLLVLPACPQMLDGDFDTLADETAGFGGSAGTGGTSGTGLGGAAGSPVGGAPSQQPDDAPLREDFETYTSDAALRAAYVPAGSGAIEASLDATRGDNEGLAMRVEFTLGTAGHVGLTRPLREDWTGALGLSIWVAPDANGRELVVQFEEASGEEWEKRVTFENAAPTRVDLPLAGFTRPGSAPGGNGVQELHSIAQVGLYLQGPAANQAILWIDDLRVLMP